MRDDNRIAHDRPRENGKYSATRSTDRRTHSITPPEMITPPRHNPFCRFTRLVEISFLPLLAASFYPPLFSSSSLLLFSKASGFSLCPPFSLLLLCVFRAASAVAAVSSICVYLSFLLSHFFVVSAASFICVYPRPSAVPAVSFAV